MFLFFFILTLSAAAFFTVLYALKSINVLETEVKVHSAVEKKKNKNIIMPLLMRWAGKAGTFLSKIKNAKFKSAMEKLDSDLKFLGAKYDKYNPYQFVVLQLFSMAAGILFCALLISTDLIIVILFAILSFSLPLLKIKESVKKRRELIFRQLPEFSDLLAIVMESGIDFFGAIEKVTSILKGPLPDELKNALSKISFGYDKKAALSETAQKCGVEQLDFFVRTVNMALDAGVGMAETLKRLAAQMRNEQTSAAEKKAQEAPVKMLIPMVIFIFPTIFIVIFGPILINFMTSGGF